MHLLLGYPTQLVDLYEKHSKIQNTTNPVLPMYEVFEADFAANKWKSRFQSAVSPLLDAAAILCAECKIATGLLILSSMNNAVQQDHTGAALTFMSALVETKSKAASDAINYFGFGLNSAKLLIQYGLEEINYHENNVRTMNLINSENPNLKNE